MIVGIVKLGFLEREEVSVISHLNAGLDKVSRIINTIFPYQGGEGRISEAENLRSSSQIQSIFNLLGRTGKNIIFIIGVGI